MTFYLTRTIIPQRQAGRKPVRVKSIAEVFTVAISNPIELAAEIVTAFVSHNSVPRSELSALFETVHAAVTRLGDGTQSALAAIETKAPAVSVRKSVTPDYLICLDDGKRFKSLRRHLSALGMTPEQYRVKWNLPADYPMVAANYAALRSAMAKKIGLGQIRKKAVARTSDAPPSASKRKGGRPRKAAAEPSAS
jgi:predicted transcriptional regulator